MGRVVGRRSRLIGLCEGLRIVRVEGIGDRGSLVGVVGVGGLGSTFSIVAYFS